MYLSVLFLPFFSFFFLSLFGFFFGSKGSLIMGLFFLFLTFFSILFLIYEVIFCQELCVLKLNNWMSIELFLVFWSFLFDSLSVLMFFVVIFISLLVHLYSIEYMANDSSIVSFFSYLSLFTFFMLLLVSGDNIILMFFGWEGVGLVSYLLMNFWYTSLEANKAAMKAILMNKIGDFSIILVMVLCFYFFKSFEYSMMFMMGSWFENEFMLFFNILLKKLDLLVFFLFLGASGKSAQMGMHPWLPAAMEGPTPVSALLHAATMVTAGVFLIFRFSYLFEYSLNVLYLVMMIGAITSFFASIIAVLQSDMKKVMACSTCSQLGYMFFMSGLSNYSMGFYHLICHAFFKALLFLNAGFIIHIFGKMQDMRMMGGLISLMPFSYIIFLFGSLSLMGFPFLSGYYSKDILLEISFSHFNFFSSFSFLIGNLAVIFTAFYSFKILYLVFYSINSTSMSFLINIFDISWSFFIMFMMLGFFSMFFGNMFFDLILGIGNFFFFDSFFSLPLYYKFFESEFIYIFMKFIPFFLNLFSFVCFYLIYYVYKSSFEFMYMYMYLWTFFYFLFLCLFTMCHVSYIYSSFVFFNFLFIYKYMLNLIENGFSEIFGNYGMKVLIWNIFFNSKYKFMKNNNLMDIQIFWMILGIFLMISFHFFMEVINNSYILYMFFFKVNINMMNITLLLCLIFSFFYKKSEKIKHNNKVMFM